MLLRRIRGVLTSALLWGTCAAIAATVLFSFMLLVDSRVRALGQFPAELFDLVSGVFVQVAAIGGLFAVIVMIAERNKTLRGLADWRIRLWGGIAGAVVGVAMMERARILDHDVLASRAAFLSLGAAALSGAFSGSIAAQGVLKGAQRARETLDA